MNFLKTTLKVLGSVAFFALLIVVFNVYLYFTAGSPTISSLGKLWWAGYHGDKSAADVDKVWCLVRFERGSDRKYSMKLLSSPISASDFKVEQRSSDKDFVEYEISSETLGIEIRAKQLYEGKRYFWGRLLAGRFRDFWKMNDEIAIRGKMSSKKGTSVDFEIEPFSAERVPNFFNNLVMRGQSNLFLAEIEGIFSKPFEGSGFTSATLDDL